MVEGCKQYASHLRRRGHDAVAGKLNDHQADKKLCARRRRVSDYQFLWIAYIFKLPTQDERPWRHEYSGNLNWENATKQNHIIMFELRG